MKVFIILSFLLLVFVACSSKHPSKLSSSSLSAVNLIDTSGYIDHNVAMIRYLLNRKHSTGKGNYFLLKQLSDSTAKIIWGNDTLKREYEEPLDLMVVDRLNVKWENNDYLILDYFTGSNAWTNVILPLNNKEQPQIFESGLWFDEKNNYIITEEVGDTIMAIHNLKTRQDQFIVEKQQPCESIMNYTCIDTISIRNKILYYKWVPRRTDKKPNSKFETRLRMKI